MARTNRPSVELAAKLLAKAGSTDSEQEAVSLALRAYSSLAEWLDLAGVADGPPLPREPRPSRDRRGLLRSSTGSLQTAIGPGHSAYRAILHARHEGERRPGSLDLRL